MQDVQNKYKNMANIFDEDGCSACVIVYVLFLLSSLGLLREDFRNNLVKHGTRVSASFKNNNCASVTVV